MCDDERMDDLIAFLSARLDEDEAAARAVKDNSAPWDGQWQPRERNALETRNGWVLAVSIPIGSDFAPGVVEHIARHDPARALREVAAGRAILDRHMPHETAFDGLACNWCSEDVDDRPQIAKERWPCPDVRSLAAVWDGHPDYRSEWKP